MRLDLYLVDHHHIPSRSKAKELILAGKVWVCDKQDQKKIVKSPSYKVSPDEKVEVLAGDTLRFVSRAGHKLKSALEHWRIDPTGALVLDVGQSTGGFSDCLLQHGAHFVVGVDVGHGQLHSSLVGHKKVLSFSGVNAKTLSTYKELEKFLGQCHGVVVDLSFISLKKVLPEVIRFLKPQKGWLVALVKPQFEVGPKGTNKKGIVLNEQKQQEVVAEYQAILKDLGFSQIDSQPSPVVGQDGNQEYLMVGYWQP